MTERFIGIENELVTFEQVNAHHPFGESDFEKLKGQFNQVYNISPTSIRTDTGHGFYIDGCELEILTPPIVLNQGFATRLTDSLIIGRETVIDANKTHRHTGYSMHWNLTNSTGRTANSGFTEGILVPFQLLGATPLSVGSAVRDKAHRYEILGDSLSNEDQIKACALLLGAYSHMTSNDNYFPLTVSSSEAEHLMVVPNGRDTIVNISSQRSSKQSTAQVALELFYKWLSPSIKSLGTKEEIDNLAAFVFGDKQLEFDRFRYFAAVQEFRGKQRGVYYPVSIPGSGDFSKVIKKTNVNRELPLENRLLGAIVRKKAEKICHMDWNSICIDCGEGEEDDQDINGIPEIYNYAATLDATLPKIGKSLDTVPTPDLDLIIPEELKGRYVLDKDLSIALSLTPQEKDTAYWEGFRKRKTIPEALSSFMLTTAVTATLALGLGGFTRNEIAKFKGSHCLSKYENVQLNVGNTNNVPNTVQHPSH